MRHKDIPQTAWESICKDTLSILRTATQQGIAIGSSNGEGGDYVVQPYPGFAFTEVIALNGVGEDSHESFVLTKDKDDSSGGFAFCKTAQKPYDVVVTAILTVVAQYTGSTTFTASSDGAWVDWYAGLKLCTDAGVKVNLRTITKLQRWMDGAAAVVRPAPIRRKALW